MPVRLATSSYSGSARLSGALAVVTNAVVTTCGICGVYRLALAWVALAWVAPARRGATRASGRPDCVGRACAAAALRPEVVGLEVVGPVLIRAAFIGTELAGADS